MTIVFVGIDLAKNVFAVHGVDEHGKAALVQPKVARGKLHEFVAALAPCTIGMEACSGAHHWARLFHKLGRTVRLMAPKFVVPYRLSGNRGKNDATDAAAICEALQRPHMRFVPVKDEAQQRRLTVHRVRQGFVQQRTATVNRMRGLLSEFGIVLPLKAATVRREAARCLEDLPSEANLVIGDLLPLRTIGAALTQTPSRHGLTARSPPQMPDIRLQAHPTVPFTDRSIAGVGEGVHIRRVRSAWPNAIGASSRTRLGKV